MFKRLLLPIITVSILFTSLFAPFSVKPAQAAWYNQGFNEWYEKVYDDDNPNEIFGERYTAAQVLWIIYAIQSIPVNIVGYDFANCAMTGDLGECAEGLRITAASNETLLAEEVEQPGIVEGILADKPISGITYVKNIGRKFNLVPEAQAQGYGFGAFEPIQHMWKAVRNVAYSLFIIIIVVMAFMIMFRVKISPQVVITVQSALPKIIIALILVTFSYAIAGFLIDLMYVVIGLLAIIAAQFHGGIVDLSPGTLFNVMTRGPTVGATGTGVLGMMVGYLISFVVGVLLVMFAEVGAWPVLGALIVGVWAPIAIAPIMMALGIIIGLIVLLAFVWMVIQAVKITFMLLKAFAMIVLLTIFAPFYIALGPIVPSLGFSSWLKSLVSQLAIFPIVGFLFVLAGSFIYQAISMAFQGFWDGGLGNIFTHLLVGSSGRGGTQLLFASSDFPPLLGDHLYPLLLLGVSATIFLIIPKATDLIQSFISGRPFAYGAATSEALGTGGSIIARPAQWRSQEQQQKYEDYKIGRRAAAAKGIVKGRDPTIEKRQQIWEVVRGFSGGKVR